MSPQIIDCLNARCLHFLFIPMPGLSKPIMLLTLTVNLMYWLLLIMPRTVGETGVSLDCYSAI